MRALSSATEAAAWLRGRVRGTLRSDSRLVQPGDGFIAWPGSAVDARRFVPNAVSAGAVACLQEEEARPSRSADALNESIATMPQLKLSAGFIASEFFDKPSQKVKVAAITGTNGKTSTAWWLAHAVPRVNGSEGAPCGLVGTLGVGIPKESGQGLISTGLTTPDPIVLQESLNAMVQAGASVCALEASSIGLEEGRLDGTEIHTAAFTNFTQDHLDYHIDMASYWRAKERLFHWPALKAAVVNVDDRQGAALAKSLSVRSELELWTTSIEGAARLTAMGIQTQGTALSFRVHEGRESFQLKARVVGRYNVANLLIVIATLRTLGYGLQESVAACHDLPPVPGRMEPLGGQGQPMVFIDYAHTPDALEKALQALRPIADATRGSLIAVFGCGGQRDRNKRPQMGRVGSQLATQVILTNDNPRMESPDQILSDIQSGILPTASIEVISDRSRAIQQAIAGAQPQDIVLVAGKGHEQYQDVGGLRSPFSDREEAQKALIDRQERMMRRSALASGSATRGA